VTLTSADAVAARGGRGPRWKLKLGAAKGTTYLYVFGGERLQLGRDAIDKSQNDVCVRVRGIGGDSASRKISGAHIRIDIEPQGVTVKDLESTGGTRVNGTRLAPKTAAPVRSSARVDLAGALELEVRVLPGEAGGAAAVVISRPQNGADQVYALIRERLVVDGSTGEVRFGAPAGTVIALHEGVLQMNGKPLAAGQSVKASGLVIDVAEIRPEDMK
jgi:hypothetical protein